MGEPVEHSLGVARLFARDGDSVAGHVLGDDAALAVEDAAARGGEKLEVDAVLVGQQAELVGLIDLKVVHSEQQCAQHRHLRTTEHECAPRDAALAFGAVAGGASHVVCLPVASSPGTRLRTPKTR